MTNTTKTLVMICLALTGASTVSAQTQPAPATRGFVNVDVGAQPARGTITTSSTFPKHDETATFTSTGGVANGPFFQVAGGVNVWRSLNVGVGISSFSSKSDSSATVVIPDPLFFNQPRTVTQVSPDLKRREVGVHLMAVWIMPITDKIDLAFSVGPSFIQVTQELVASANVPTGTQTFTPNVTSNSGTAKGANIGVDGSYMVTNRVGIGILLRYAGGSVNLESVSSTKAGGFQAAIGARVRF